MNYLLIERVKKEYNFKSPIILKKLETREKRRAFLIADNKNKYVLKILPKKKELIARLDFLPKIKDRGVNFPTIIDTKSNKKYFSQSGNIFFLSEFIDQKENSPSRYFFSHLGYAVGKFHGIKIKSDLIPNLNIEGKIKKLKILFLKKKIDIKIKKEVIDFLDSFPSTSNATIGIVHGDISYFNVLGRKKLFFIDFDDVSIGPIAYDLGQMIAFMFHLIPFDFPKFEMKTKHMTKPLFLKNKFEFFMKNYSKKIKLSREDIEILPQMAMLACVENICPKSTGGIFKWNYKRFKIINEEKNTITNLSKKYFIERETTREIIK